MAKIAFIDAGSTVFAKNVLGDCLCVDAFRDAEIALIDIDPQRLAVNRTNINVQELTIEAALIGRRDHVYQAALLDPHTGAELTIDQTVALCDELIAAHGDYLPPLA